VLVAGLCLAACGSSNDKLASLPGGRATGPGFSFPLNGDWRALRNLQELQKVVSGSTAKQLPGLDIGAGFVFGGAWTDTAHSDAHRSVNVVIEPATSDSALDDIARSSITLLERSTNGARIATGRSRLAGEPAIAYALTSLQHGRHTASHGLIVHRGPYVYTVTVQERAPGKGLDPVERKLLAGWRWVPPSGSGVQRLARLRSLSGSGYHVTLPPGWRGTLGKAAAQAGLTGVDSLWRGHLSNTYSTTVNVGATRAPVKSVDSATNAVARVERATAKQSGGRFKLQALTKSPEIRLGGSKAGVLDITSTADGVRLRQVEVVALHGGRVYRITLSAERAREHKDARAFRQALTSWRWRG
jgi:hypothetical protein